jgi:hypothetical protein
MCLRRQAGMVWCACSTGDSPIMRFQTRQAQHNPTKHREKMDNLTILPSNTGFPLEFPFDQCYKQEFPAGAGSIPRNLTMDPGLNVPPL